ncbi:MAG: glycoside hydrolase family 71/99-like protein [Planctomycetota bacterium]
MPWFQAKPPENTWGWHWTMGHFDPEAKSDGKRQIASKFYPVIEPYDSGDPQVLECHLLMMKLAGIDGVIVDWYGRTDFRDYAVLHRNTTRLLQQCERLKMKFVICYEDQTVPALVDARRLDPKDRVTHVAQEINWLSRYWFKSGSYVRLNGRPVLMSFGHTGLTNDEWKQCLSKLNSPVAYFSQDYRRDGAEGAFGWPAPNVGLTQVDKFKTESKAWPNSVPVAFPRFIDSYRAAKVSGGFPELPDDDGRTFRMTLSKAIGAGSSIIQIATWNDWGEGTQIEPSREFGYRDLELVQRTRREMIGLGFILTEEDLRLPVKLLEARRAFVEHSSTCDQAAIAISENRLDDAKRIIRELTHP